MCKHILIRNVVKEDAAIIRQFAALTYDKDGYGAIIRTKQGKIDTFKSLSLVEFYMCIGALLEQGNIQDLVLHHRTSTNGDGLDYAHPFHYAGHFLTHNGVVSVPGEHKTATKNDSEALLHHLIKTGYDTKSISGYFSCFILSEAETVILVDSIAPIYTDNRVYCSHKLDDEMTKLELVKVTIDTNGQQDVEAIEVTETSYGSNLAYLSLGSSITSAETAIEDEALTFLDYLDDYEWEAMGRARDMEALWECVERVCIERDFRLSWEAFEYLTEYFGVVPPSNYAGGLS